MFNLENNIINGLALAIVTLILFMVISTLVPVLILDRIGVPKKITNRFVGVFALIGSFIWGYLMFYLDYSSLFL